MKKTIVMLLATTCCFRLAHAQNVGIGIAVPAYNLHVYNANAATVAVQSNDVNSPAELRLQGVGVYSVLKRFGATEVGTLAGLPVDNMTSMYASSGGNLLIGTSSSSSINFATSGSVKMEISGSGNVGIGEGASSLSKLNINSSTGSGIFSTTSYSPVGNVLVSSILGRIPIATEGVRAAVIGTTYDGVSSPGFVQGNYGVVGAAITNGYGVAAFATGGANGIYSYVSGAGKALVTYGPLQLQNIGEGAGKILVSDAVGNATWQTIAGSHNHFGETWAGSVSAAYNAGPTVSNNSTVDRTAAIQGLQTAATGNYSSGVRGDATSSLGIGVLGTSYTGGPFNDPYPTSGICGMASTGTGVAGRSYAGTGVYGNSTNGKAAHFEMPVIANTNPVVLITANSKTALEVNNGFIKVSGTNKTAFVHTATAGNTTVNYTNLSYINPSNTDIVIVTPNWNPGGTGSTYLNKAIGVFWTGSTWAIFIQDTSNMPVTAAFNVLVIKQ